MGTKFSLCNLVDSLALMGQWAEVNLEYLVRDKLNLNILIEQNNVAQLFYEWCFYKSLISWSNHFVFVFFMFQGSREV